MRELGTVSWRYPCQPGAMQGPNSETQAGENRPLAIVPGEDNPMDGHQGLAAMASRLSHTEGGWPRCTRWHSATTTSAMLS